MCGFRGEGKEEWRGCQGGVKEVWMREEMVSWLSDRYVLEMFTNLPRLEYHRAAIPLLTHDLPLQH